MSKTLSPEQRARLAECEASIQKGLLGSFEAGLALAEIRDAELYSENHATFEEYLSQVWDIGRAYGYQLMSAAAVRTNLAQKFDRLPENEFQARPLSRLTPEEQQQIWGQVLKQAGPDAKTPYKMVKGAVDDLLQAQKLAEIARDHAERDDGSHADHQFRFGDPVALIGELPAESVDLLLISGLPGTTPATMAQSLTELLKSSLPIMKPDHQVFVIADLHDTRPLLDVAEALTYEAGVPLIWVTDKERSILDWSAKSSARAILHFRQGTAGLITQIGNVLECDDETFKHHPDQKPLALIQKLIEISTQLGDTVLDPTAVAATTNVACRLSGRNCTGITSDQEGYDAGLERLHENLGPVETPDFN